ncbi:four helix bundle protein [Panacibacter ginsenosidivorans]|uniref:Four helix bundle protein n=1 Tax=Panacibacter ginsenosidivorans TaxID=1813871 RepID=A0A5B8V7C7_9BACT|nr:four helix bundle protein [Panacibacter ginsenosidivorans]QEC67324.1 four helix bundle protein [Panacibacter ginsenosidivorans]
MSQIKSYRDLIVWQKSIELVKNIYLFTQSFPKEEQYGLTNQMRRCAVSIPSNIAEGYGRNATGDYKRFLQIAVGSLYELQTQLEISFHLKYLDENNFISIIALCTEIDKMLYSLIQKVK